MSAVNVNAIDYPSLIFVVVSVQEHAVNWADFVCGFSAHVFHLEDRIAHFGAMSRELLDYFEVCKFYTGLLADLRTD
jgi:hypothetical protein